MNELTQSLMRPLRSLRIALVVCFLLMMGRLAWLQIYWGTYFITRSQKNFLRIETQKSARGNIFDCRGILLATNRPVSTVLWQGTGNYQLDETQKTCLATLEEILQLPLLSNADKIGTITHAERRYKKEVLASDITFEQLSKVEELFPTHKNVTIQTQFERIYPHATHASHVVGYLSREMDQPTCGRMGLEKLFQETLKGEQGTVLKTINSFGRDIGYREIQKARTGTPIQTTIDLELQKLCESVFPQGHTGAVIIMEPDTGALRAFLSQPSFDPNIFLNPISPEEWKTMQSEGCFLNRALFSTYPPGSIFKLVSISAALEHNLITPDLTFVCRGGTEFRGRRYECARQTGHGELNIWQAIAHSCNIIFYHLAQRMDINTFAEYGRRFGLGQETGIIFTEKKGHVPTREWKKEHLGEPWWPGETLSISIGQGYLLVTPLQVARMISSIFTGYLVRPRIIESEPIDVTPLAIKQETLNFLRVSMKSVVQQGTGLHAKRVKDIEIFAKTSTAQTSDKQKRELGSQYLEHGWFVAHFTYKKEKPLVMVILAENIGSSRVVTRAATDLLIGYKALVNKRNEETLVTPSALP